MKKYLAMLCAAMLFACCLGLAACGGSSSSSAAASGSADASASASASASAEASTSASASAASSSAAAQATFAGEWKMAGIESQGLTMVGDLSSVMDSEMVLTLKDDGTGTMTMGENSANLKWVEKDAKTATLTVEATEDSEGNTVDVTLDDDGSLRMALEDESMSGDVIFTADGKYAGAAEIDVTGATAITDEKDLVGTWTLSGLKMMGISMYGDPASLAAMAGDTDVTVTFEAGGKATLMGQEVSYEIGADGTAITEDGISLAIKALDGNLILDMSEALGMEMVMVFSK